MSSKGTTFQNFFKRFRTIMSISPPFFILGNPRSGTSLLRLMLNNHPEIIVPPECGFLLWLAEKYTHQLEYNTQTYINFTEDLFKTKKIETWNIKKNNLLKIIKSKKPKTYSEMTSLVYTYYAKTKFKTPSIHGDKNNYYINEIRIIDQLFPQSKHIFIIRDGRDVAASYLNIRKENITSQYKPNLPRSISEIAHQWKKSTFNAQKRLGDPNSCVIRYEDLVQKPIQTLSLICSHLDTYYTDEMLNYYLNNDEPTEFLQWKAKTKQPVDCNSLSKYKKELSNDQIEFFENCAFEALKAFNYI